MRESPDSPGNLPSSAVSHDEGSGISTSSASRLEGVADVEPALETTQVGKHDLTDTTSPQIPPPGRRLWGPAYEKVRENPDLSPLLDAHQKYLDESQNPSAEGKHDLMYYTKSHKLNNADD